ncbi:MAG: YbaK/EbsC family protein [Anaerolineaceae bacterium]|nr:YbaK/EbsC family protein [Anaerolineaceae bacterium]MBN2678426.1 YbaK/EbsC family protein [Anaerolineaceae bacterium]
MDKGTYPPGVLRFINILEAHSILPVLADLPNSTQTAPEAAQAVGCQLNQIVKSLLFITNNTRRPILVLASGANRVNPVRLAEVIGEKIHLADAQTVLQLTGYPVGSVPPAGYTPQPSTLIDSDLAGFDILWVSAGSDHIIASLSFQDLCQLSGGRVTTISQ